MYGVWHPATDTKQTYTTYLHSLSSKDKSCSNGFHEYTLFLCGAVEELKNKSLADKYRKQFYSSDRQRLADNTLRYNTLADKKKKEKTLHFGRLDENIQLKT